ncbi:SpoIIE family protein phosphatase [Streptomyces sp. NPDC092296]|uniref:SpoIIE family protein phosphatase n=1 Tax=Streptomyces sp. NPDC092296 TaxID=3366012 RepID=UPI00382C8EAE
MALSEIKVIWSMSEHEQREETGAPGVAAPGRPSNVLDQVRLATWLIGSDGRTVVAWGEPAVELLGYRASEVLGRDATQVLVAERDRAAAAAVLDRVLAGERFAEVFPMLHRDGRRVPVEFRTEPLVGSDGQITILSVATDALAVRGVEGGLTVLDAFFSQSPVGLAVYDTQLRCVRVNGAFAAMAGRPPGQLIGRPVSQGLLGTAATEVERIAKQVVSTGLPVVDFHVIGRTPADPEHDRVWSLSHFPLQDAAGRVVGTSSSIIDVTDQHRARQRLTLMNEASIRIGTTLDVDRSAQELTDVAVPRLADAAAVDLLDAILHGAEPTPASVGPTPALHRLGVSTAHRPPPRGDPATGLGHLRGAVFAASPLCSRCLATGQPVLLTHLDEPGPPAADGGRRRAAGFHEHGVHSVMVVPLVSRGTVLGAASFTRSGGREPFDEDDLALAADLAARAAVCIDNARRYARERTAALALQRSLLPGDLPKQTALEVAHRYLPAGARAGVGGDWFDVIPLSGARVALVVGDVAGHGLHAAATMGRLRTTVRALAQLDLAPDELLTHLDDLVGRLADEQAGSDGQLASDQTIGAACLYAVYDPVTRRCVLSRAGHFPPAIVTPDGTVTFPELPAGPPLGLGGLPFEAVELELPEHSLIALYTNGLVENRSGDVDVGLARLSSVLARPGQTPEQLCGQVVDALLPNGPFDDVALLLARTRALTADQVATWELATDPAVVGRARTLATEQLAAWGLADTAFTTELVVSELVTNAIRHAHGPIRLRLIRDRSLICEVSDAGHTSPNLRRARTTDEGGRGLFLVAQLSQRWGTRYTPDGKVIWTEQPL